MLVHIGGFLGAIGAAILVLVTYNFEPGFHAQIAFLYGFLALVFGAGGWALKESEAEKNPIPKYARFLWGGVCSIVLAIGLYPYFQAWALDLNIGQQVFLVFVIPIGAFLIWVHVKGGGELQQ